MDSNHLEELKEITFKERDQTQVVLMCTPQSHLVCGVPLLSRMQRRENKAHQNQLCRFNLKKWS